MHRTAWYTWVPPRRNARILVPCCAALLLGALSPAAALPSDVGMEPYRAFVRTPRAARLLNVARDAMRRHWGESATTRDTTELRWPAAPLGVFLTLTDGRTTRACVGSVSPYRGGLVETVRDLALQALQADRRQQPIRHEELPRLRVIIAFAGTGESVADPMDVDPGREGLLISSGKGSIAFLPGEARTVSWALQEARRVGVLQGPLENVTYYRFPVAVLAEPP